MSQPTNWGVPRTDGGNEYTPEQFAERTDDSFDALLSLHKGNSRPAYAEAGTLWLDDNSTPWVLKLFDGSDDITIGTVNPSDNKFTPARAVLYEAQTLDPSEQAQARANIGLGNSATRNVGTTSGTVAAGDDSRINSAMRNKGTLGQTDLNTIGAFGDYGVYYQTANADATPQRNYPVQSAGALIVAPAAYGCVQMYLPYDMPRIFVRGLSGSWNGSGPWRDWGEIASTPVEAIIERGSNANGEYVRFADGTQICTHVIGPVSLTASGITGSVCKSSSQSVSFPATFSSPPYLSLTARKDSGPGIVWGATDSTTITASGASGLCVGGSQVDATARLHVMAVGRWF
jgi:hypothetical protein